jgi:hypothetical protein
MRHMLLRLGALVDQRDFKRSRQGWIFRAPILWCLGPRPHYLVSDTQKAKIEMVVGAGNLVASLLLPAMALVLFLWAPSTLPMAPSVAHAPVLFFVIFGLVVCSFLVSGLQNLYRYVGLRPLLKNLPRTTEKITFAERLKPLTATVPVWFLIVPLIMVLATLFFSAYEALTANAWDIFPYLAVAVSSWWIIYISAMLWVKLRLPGRI